MRKYIPWLFLAAFLITAGVGCSQQSVSNQQSAAPSPAPTPASASAPVVTVSNFTFQPAAVSVKTGDTITWRQMDSVPHSIVISDGTSSSILGQGKEFSHTFSVAGHYTYNCGIHPTMKGIIDVQ